MGFISKQWLRGDALRNRGHVPVPVAIEAIELIDEFDSRNDVKVLLRVTLQHGFAGDYQLVHFTKEEVELALPSFLRKSDLTDLSLGDPRRAAIVTALSKLNKTELSSLLSDIKAAQVKTEPPDSLNIASFAKELGLPCTLLLEQFQAAGVSKLHESDPITELDKENLLVHLRQANNAESNVKDARHIKTIPATNTTDAQERQLMTEAVKAGKLARAQMMLEAKQGKRTLDFVKVRKLEMDIEQIEKELKLLEK